MYTLSKTRLTLRKHEALYFKKPQELYHRVLNPRQGDKSHKIRTFLSLLYPLSLLTPKPSPLTVAQRIFHFRRPRWAAKVPQWSSSPGQFDLGHRWRRTVSNLSKTPGWVARCLLHCAIFWPFRRHADLHSARPGLVSTIAAPICSWARANQLRLKFTISLS